MRLDKKLGDEALALDIDIKSTIEEALKQKVVRTKTKRLSKVLKETIEKTGISKREWIKSIRETRDGR